MPDLNIPTTRAATQLEPANAGHANAGRQVAGVVQVGANAALGAAGALGGINGVGDLADAAGLEVLLDPTTDSFTRQNALLEKQQEIQTQNLIYTTTSNISKAEYDAKKQVVTNLKA